MNVSPNTYINLRSSKERERWVCFFCDKKCKCKACLKLKAIERKKKKNMLEEKKPEVKVGTKYELGEFTIIEDKQDSDENENNEKDIEGIEEDENENDESVSNLMGKPSSIIKIENDENRNLNGIINIVEIAGKKNKQIRKQCLCCKIINFNQGQIFIFISFENFLTYLKHYVENNKNLIEQNRENHKSYLTLICFLIDITFTMNNLETC